jgi:hypothetical protein
VHIESDLLVPIERNKLVCGCGWEKRCQGKKADAAHDILVTRRIMMATGVAPCVSVEPFNTQS